MAIVLALMAMLLLSALGAGLVLTTTTETLITANYRDNAEALYAADAGVERVLPDLLQEADWNRILSGAERSSFVDGAPEGERKTPFGGVIDLTKATNMLNCGKVTACATADLNAWTDERPWTTNNPRWQLYAYGPLSNLLPADAIDSQMYLIVWVADDPSDNDNDPLVDGGPPENNPGRGQVAMRAEAFGLGGINRAIEVTVARTDVSEMERGYLAQRGQDEQNLRSRRAAVGRPGRTLARTQVTLVP